jgi:hypothetical protein
LFKQLVLENIANLESRCMTAIIKPFCQGCKHILFSNRIVTICVKTQFSYICNL